MSLDVLTFLLLLQSNNEQQNFYFLIKKITKTPFNIKVETDFCNIIQLKLYVFYIEVIA